MFSTATSTASHGFDPGAGSGISLLKRTLSVAVETVIAAGRQSDHGILGNGRRPGDGARCCPLALLSSRFSGVAYAKMSLIVRVLCAAASRCC